MKTFTIKDALKTIMEFAPNKRSVVALVNGLFILKKRKNFNTKASKLLDK